MSDVAKHLSGDTQNCCNRRHVAPPVGTTWRQRACCLEAHMVASAYFEEGDLQDVHCEIHGDVLVQEVAS